MHSKSQHVDGRWWRADSYEWRTVKGRKINESILIPSANAKLVSYDPWEQYRLHEHRTRSERVFKPPYTDLLDMALDCTRITSPESASEYEAWKTKRTDAAARFAQVHGLLGILPALALSIRFPFTHLVLGGAIKFSGPDGQLENIPTNRSTQLCYHRVGGEWHSVLMEYLWSPGDLDDSPPGVTRFSDGCFHVSETDLAVLRTFFPSWDDQSIPFPLPGSEAFFLEYGEREGDIHSIAHEFLRAATAMSSIAATAEDRKRASVWMTTVAQGAVPSFKFTSNGLYLEEVHHSSSLIASFALMFLWDRSAGRRALRCQECGSHFVSDDRRAAYCSRSHRLTASSKRYRARKVNVEEIGH